MRKALRSALLALVIALACAGTAAAAATTQSGDNLRNGWYPSANVSPAVVQSGTFGQLWSANVNGQVYAQPLVTTGPNGTRSVIATTETNHVYALNPSDGSQRWSKDLGTPWNPGDIGCADITPAIGDTSTPVVDPTTNTVYLTRKTYASGSSGAAVWYMDALDIATGSERPGFPVKLNGAADNAPSVSFAATTQQQRTGLLLLDGVVYAGFGSHCDAPPWKGWVFGVNASTGKVTARWVDIVSPTTDGAGIWQSGTGLMSDGPGTIVLTTGNGGAPHTPAPGSTPETSYGDSVVRLDVQPDGTLEPVDFFAPFDAIQLDNTDADFASGGIVGLPDQQFGTASIPHLAVVDGKEGYVYLLNRDDLGGYQQGAGGGDAVVQRLGPFAGVWGRPGVWPGDGGYVYITPAGSQLAVYKYSDSNGQPALASVGATDDEFGWGSGSPIITSDGTTSGSATMWVIWAADRTGAGGQLRAYAPVPVNGKLKLIGEWSIGHATNYSIPGVGDDGHLYVGTRDGKILAFGSPVTEPVTAPALSYPPTVQGATSQLTLQITANEPVTIDSLSVSAPEFQVGTTSLPASLTAGQKLSIPVTFAPSDAPADIGTIGGQITIQTDAGPVVVPVSGIGRSASPLLHADQPRLALGGTAIGQQLSGTVTFTNEGNQPLTITGTKLPAAPFSATGAPAVGATMAPGQTDTITIDFKPSGAGTFSDQIELVSDVGGTASIGISGTAAAPGLLHVSPGALDFGSVAIGATATRSFSITNAGGTTVTIERSKPPFGGEFSAVTALPEGSTIAPGKAVTERVRFSPTAAGTAKSSWSINGNDPSGVHNVHFTGTGTAAAPPAPPGPPTTSTGGGGTPPPSTQPLRRPRAPRLSRATVQRAAIRQVRVKYTAVTAATSTFSVERRQSWVRNGTACVRPTGNAHRGRRCVHWLTVGTSRHVDRIGPVRLRLTGIVAAGRLRPGVYRLRSVLHDSAGGSHAFIARLRVTGPVAHASTRRAG